MSFLTEMLSIEDGAALLNLEEIEKACPNAMTCDHLDKKPYCWNGSYTKCDEYNKSD